MKRKKPDIIVWDEERGYYAKELTYGSDLGAPIIKLEDVKGWRQHGVTEANNYFKAKFLELKEIYEKYVEEFNWNELIYSQVDYSFIPIIGHTYHLYERDNGQLFLSLIEPTMWKMNYIGSFTLDPTNKWVKK